MDSKIRKIHIGKRIKEIFTQKKMTVNHFAELLHCDRTNVYNIFRRKKIDIDMLLEISNILNHNFVEEVCAIHEFYKNIFPSKVCFTLEIDSMDNNALKVFLKMIKQLNIKMIREKKE